MRNKKIIYSINTFLFLTAILLAVNTFSPGGHEFIRSVLAQAGIVGGGTVPYLARFAGAQGTPSNTIGDSAIYQDGVGNIGIGTTNPTWHLTVTGYIGSPLGFTTVNRDDGLGQSVIYRQANVTHLWDNAVGNVISFNNAGNVGIGMGPSGNKLDVNGTIRTAGHVISNNTSPTLYLQDTDHRTAMVHVNSNYFYILRGCGVNDTNICPFNGVWPLTINLENNDASFGGYVTTAGLRSNVYGLDTWFPFTNGYNYIRGNTFINGTIFDEQNAAYALDPSETSVFRAIKIWPQAAPAVLSNGMMWMEP